LLDGPIRFGKKPVGETATTRSIGSRPKENFAQTTNRRGKKKRDEEKRWNRPFRENTLLNILGTAPIMFIPASRPIHCITSAIDRMLETAGLRPRSKAPEPNPILLVFNFPNSLLF
jgi:hypothetical protein